MTPEYKQPEPMGVSEVVSFMGRLVDQGLNDDSGDISEQRKNTLKAYYGDTYGDERDGHSQIVTREVAETVEWAKPHLMRIFASGDRVVSFVPAGQEDEQQAEQETDAVRHELFERNNGFMSLLSWIHDALMYPNGYAKIWPDKTETVTTEEYQDLDIYQISDLMFDKPEDEEVELLEQEENEETQTWNIKLKRKSSEVRIKFEAVEPDQLIVDGDVHQLSLDGIDCVHRIRRTFTWLVQNGIDPEELRQVRQDEENDYGDERTNRVFYDDENPNNEADDTEATREYWVHEGYVSLDVDGDGIAERRRILMIGDKIFENEEDDYNPFCAMSSMPQPHKHTGVSIANLAEVWQRVQTVLHRNLLDNVYRSAVNRKLIGEQGERADGETMDALADGDADIIPVRDVNQIVDEVTVNHTPQLLQAIDAMNNRLKMTTGVSPDLTLDPNVLRDSTEGAYMGAMEQASERLELVARIYAETGIKEAIYKAHRLMREHVKRSRVIRLRGEWIEVDPTAWRERRDLTVEVGTGFKSREKRIALMQSLLTEQKESLQLGLPTVQAQNIYNTQLKLADAMGERNPNMFFTDPSQLPPPQPPPPDPNIIAIEAQKQIEGEKRQVEMTKAQLDKTIKEQQMLIDAKQKAIETHLKQNSESHNQSIDVEKLRLEYEKLELQKELEGLKTANAASDRALKEKDLALKAAIEDKKIDQGERQFMENIKAQVKEVIPPQNSGKRHLTVRRTPDGLEGESRPID